MVTETSTATAAPAPVVTTATESTATEAAPAVDSTLAAAVQAYDANKHKRTARGPSIGEKVAAKVEPEAAAAPTAEAPAAPVAETPVADVVEPPAAAEAAKEPVKEEPKKEDEVPSALAQYLREKRAVGRRSAEVEKEKAALAEQRAKFEAERKATEEQVERERKLETLRASNPVQALEEMFGRDALMGTLPFDILARSAELSGESAPTPERIAEAAAARAKLEIMQEMKTAEEAKAKAELEAKAKADEARKVENERGKEAFFVGLSTQFDEVRDQYPFLSTAGFEIEKVDQFMAAQFAKTRKLPEPSEIFRHFEALREREAEALAATLAKKRGTPAPVAPATAKPGPTAAIHRGATVDTRGKVTAAIPANESPSQRRNRIAAELDATLGR